MILVVVLVAVEWDGGGTCGVALDVAGTGNGGTGLGFCRSRLARLRRWRRPLWKRGGDTPGSDAGPEQMQNRHNKVSGIKAGNNTSLSNLMYKHKL